MNKYSIRKMFARRGTTAQKIRSFNDLFCTLNYLFTSSNHVHCAFTFRSDLIAEVLTGLRISYPRSKLFGLDEHSIDGLI